MAVVKEKNWSEFIQKFIKKGVIYIDFEELKFDIKTKDNFVDADHLSEKGSEVFVNLFRKKLFPHNEY